MNTTDSVMSTKKKDKINTEDVEDEETSDNFDSFSPGPTVEAIYY
jgi:hypothetical protein